MTELQRTCQICLDDHMTSIGEIYQNNPIVHTCLKLHFNGSLSYEQALIQAIIHLTHSEEKCKQTLMDKLGNHVIALSLSEIDK